MGETLQHTPILPAIPTEEYLILTKYAADAKNRNMTVLQDVQIIIPKLILDEESLFRTHQSQKTTGITDCVKRQIANNISTFIILTDFIS